MAERGPYQLDPFTWIRAIHFDSNELTVLDFMNKKYMVKNKFQQVEEVITHPEFVGSKGLDLISNRNGDPWRGYDSWNPRRPRSVRIINSPNFLSTMEGAFDQFMRIYEGRTLVIEYEHHNTRDEAYEEFWPGWFDCVGGESDPACEIKAEQLDGYDDIDQLLSFYWHNGTGSVSSGMGTGNTPYPFFEVTQTFRSTRGPGTPEISYWAKWYDYWYHVYGPWTVLAPPSQQFGQYSADPPQPLTSYCVVDDLPPAALNISGFVWLGIDNGDGTYNAPITVAYWGEEGANYGFGWTDLIYEPRNFYYNSFGANVAWVYADYGDGGQYKKYQDADPSSLSDNQHVWYRAHYYPQPNSFDYPTDPFGPKIRGTPVQDPDPDVNTWFGAGGPPGGTDTTEQPSFERVYQEQQDPYEIAEVTGGFAAYDAVDWATADGARIVGAVYQEAASDVDLDFTDPTFAIADPDVGYGIHRIAIHISRDRLAYSVDGGSVRVYEGTVHGLPWAPNFTMPSGGKHAGEKAYHLPNVDTTMPTWDNVKGWGDSCTPETWTEMFTTARDKAYNCAEIGSSYAGMAGWVRCIWLKKALSDRTKELARLPYYSAVTASAGWWDGTKNKGLTEPPKG